MDVMFALLGLASVLLILGLVLVGLLLRRWHRSVLRRINERTQVLDQRLAATNQALAAVRDELRDTRKSMRTAIDAAADRLAKRSVDPARLDKAVRTGTVDTVRRTRSGVGDDMMRMFRQLEATQNLYALVDIDRPLPTSRVWAASPDLLLYMVDLVDRRRPELIVECGSGLSTLWFAFALRRFGVDGRVVSLEHLEDYADQTRTLVERHGVADLVEVRSADLEQYEFDGETFRWYGQKTWTDLDDIDLLFVDGPPADTNTHARFPALPLLLDKLSPTGAVLLDDLVRTDEQEVLESWLSSYPDLTAERIRLEKHAALVHR